MNDGCHRIANNRIVFGTGERCGLEAALGFGTRRKAFCLATQPLGGQDLPHPRQPGYQTRLKVFGSPVVKVGSQIRPDHRRPYRQLPARCWACQNASEILAQVSDWYVVRHRQARRHRRR